MNKLFRFLPLIVIFLLSSCRINTSIEDNLTLKIDDFTMNQFSEDGEKIYTIISPKSNLNKITFVYELDTVEVIFYEEDKETYLLTADYATLDNNLLTLHGNVKIKDIEDIDSIIKSNYLYWDMKKSLITLEGNVFLEDPFINLYSSKAILNQDSDIIKFFNPVQYKYKDSTNQIDFEVSSDNAFYDLNEKKMTFSSDGDRVRSTLFF